MLDVDLEELYQVDTKVLNQAVKRNLARFPESFRFQLNDLEKQELVTNCDRFNRLKHSTVNPFAFTEQWVATLSVIPASSVIPANAGIYPTDCIMDSRLRGNDRYITR